jgi:hypothetical protein
MNRGFGRAVAAATGFVAGYTVFSALGIAVAVAGRAPTGDSTRALLEQFAMTAYFVVLHGSLSAIVFAAIAAFCRRWRQLGTRAAFLWGAVAGMAGGAIYWSGLAGSVLKFLSVALGAGPSDWIRPAIWFVTLLPGILAGLAVVLWSTALRPTEKGPART